MCPDQQDDKTKKMQSELDDMKKRVSALETSLDSSLGRTSNSSAKPFEPTTATEISAELARRDSGDKLLDEMARGLKNRGASEKSPGRTSNSSIDYAKEYKSLKADFEQFKLASAKPLIEEMLSNRSEENKQAFLTAIEGKSYEAIKELHSIESQISKPTEFTPTAPSLKSASFKPSGVDSEAIYF